MYVVVTFFQVLETDWTFDFLEALSFAGSRLGRPSC
jgi:hypothetical protein